MCGQKFFEDANYWWWGGIWHQKQKDGIGLNNMRERAISLNGFINIESKIGEGTTIEVIFNLQSAIHKF